MTPSPPWCMTFGSNFSTTAGVPTSARAVSLVPRTPGTVADLRTAFPPPEMELAQNFPRIQKVTVPNQVASRIVHRGEGKYPWWRSPAADAARPRDEGNQQAGV